MYSYSTRLYSYSTRLNSYSARLNSYHSYVSLRSGMRACHLRDGAAVVEFFAWLEQTVLIEGRPVSEVDIDLQVTAHRARDPAFMDRSFDTIAGVNGNGAVIHYRAALGASNAQFTSADMLLLDSGAQSIDGTTDVTRTIHLGQPTAPQRAAFTRVLKGHMALDAIVFPAGTLGCQLDAFARQHLWAAGIGTIQ